VEDELGRKTMKTLRQRHYPEPWGRSSEGTEATLQTLGIEDVRRFFHTHYSPRGAILGVAGALDWPRLVADVERLFAGWDAPGPQPPLEQPPPRGYCHLPVDAAQTHVGLAVDAVPYGHPDYFLIRAAVGVLSDSMSSRLFTEVREKRGLVYTVQAVCHSLRDRGAILAYAGTTAERAQETLDVLWSEIVRLHDGVTAEELTRLKGRIKRVLILEQESSPARASALALDWYYLGRVRTMDELSAIFDGLSTAAINDYLAAHRPTAYTLVTVGRQELVPPAVPPGPG
jgi:predicted Zn-dependent peptidase